MFSEVKANRRALPLPQLTQLSSQTTAPTVSSWNPSVFPIRASRLHIFQLEGVEFQCWPEITLHYCGLQRQRSLCVCVCGDRVGRPTAPHLGIFPPSTHQRRTATTQWLCENDRAPVSRQGVCSFCHFFFSVLVEFGWSPTSPSTPGPLSLRVLLSSRLLLMFRLPVVLSQRKVGRSSVNYVFNTRNARLVWRDVISFLLHLHHLPDDWHPRSFLLVFFVSFGWGEKMEQTQNICDIKGITWSLELQRHITVTTMAFKTNIVKERYD